MLSLPAENTCGCVDDFSNENVECICTASGLVQIVGRKYALRLLTAIGDQPGIRFNDLRSEMNEISSSTLSVRLAELERAFLISRKTFHEAPQRVEYTLTENGRNLRQSLFAFSKYSQINSQ